MPRQVCKAKPDDVYRERFERYYTPEPNTGCWLWISTLNTYGYGEFLFRGQRYKAHRAAYELFRGVIPRGRDLDHLCRVRSCVNPDHLEPVSAGENVRRGIGFTGVNFRKTHCKHGHEFSAENTYTGRRLGSRTWRQCRICQKRAHRDYVLRQRGAVNGLA